jgi:hypothetical protein
MKKMNSAPQNSTPQTASLVERETTTEELVEVVDYGKMAFTKKAKTPKAPKVEEVPVVEEVVAVEEVKSEEEVVDPATY